MAYDDSGELPIASDPSEENTYDLGGYSFELEIQNVHEPGEPDVVSVFARCYGPDGTRETQATDFPSGTNVIGWYVEANETEASVYATVKEETYDLPTNLPKPIQTVTGTETYHQSESDTDIVSISLPVPSIMSVYGGGIWFVMVSSEPISGSWSVVYRNGNTMSSPAQQTGRVIREGKTAYYGSVNFGSNVAGVPTSSFYNAAPDDNSIWMAVYGNGDSDPRDVLIARFAIDIREADGGPDGDWDEPGDDGDPSYTLYVSVTGASAGTHNGGVPTTPGDAEVYGCGGTGGNGGGGGAGASTVIIYDFATSKAGSVEQEANSRGPGAGGPGGRGGKGADGCILVFY